MANALKRHMYESIESYLLRLEIPIYNCTSLVSASQPTCTFRL